MIVKRSLCVNCTIIVAMIALSMVLVRLMKYSEVFVVLNALWSILILKYVFSRVKSFDKLERTILKMGILIRVTLSVLFTLFFDTIGKSLMHIDSTMFYEIGKNYFYNDYSRYNTRFPEAIKMVFNVSGPGLLILLMINLLIWFESLVLILKVSGEGNAKRRIIIAFYCFFPMNLYLNVNVLRETIMSFFIMLAIYFTFCWMQQGKYKDLVLAVLVSIPAVILHSVSVALWLGVYLVYFFWDVDLKRWKVSRDKTITIIPMLFMFLLFLFMHSKGYFAYLPMDVSLKGIVEKERFTGRSDYLTGIEVNGMIPFAGWTVVRSVYFWLSPMIYDISTMKDAIAFFVDSIPFIGLFFALLIHKSNNKYYKSIIIFLAIYTILYAWGTGNAGTAMRHRGMLVGVVLMLYGLKARRMPREVESLA